MLHGVMPILPAIFRANGAIDEAGTRGVLDYIIASGATGIVFPGLASEYDMLADDERLHMTKLIGEWIGDRVPFVVGASAATIYAAIQYAVAGANAGAEAAMIMTPHALKDDLKSMTDFYRDVAEASGSAIILQNAPAPMGLNLPLEDVASIAREVTAVRYVKEEAMPSGQRITILSRLAGSHVNAVFGGAGGRYLIDELNRGARGTMPACEITELHVAMVSAWDSGDRIGARNLFERTLPLLSMQSVFRWRLTKAVLQRRGLIEDSFVRAPGPSLDRHDVAELDALLERLADLLPLPLAAPMMAQ